MDLTNVLLVFASAVIALLGQALVQRLVHGFNRAKERDAVLRTKGEELVMALLDYGQWFDFQVRDMFGAKEERPNPFTKVRALQQLYFPALDGDIAQLGGLELSVVGRRDHYRSREYADIVVDYTADQEFAAWIEKHTQVTNHIVDTVCAITRRTLED